MTKLPLAGLLAALLISQVSAGITLEKLQDIMVGGTEASASRYLYAIKEAFEGYDIYTPLRQAHFLAQIGHESASLKAAEENLNYKKEGLLAVFGKYFKTDAEAAAFAHKPEKIANRVYANRLGNGNETSGDGWKYRGRGLIQLTGKDNYKRFNRAAWVDVLSNPDLVASDPHTAVHAAGWFWHVNGLNSKADNDDIVGVTRIVNGRDLHGLDSRKAYLARAKIALRV